MMIVTGAASFLGSCMISKLNQHNFNYIVATADAAAVDTATVNAATLDNGNNDKLQNLHGKKIQQQIDTTQLPAWLDQHQELTEFIFHLSFDAQTFENQLSTHETQDFGLLKILWQQCIRYQIPLIFSFAQSERAAIEEWIHAQDKSPFFWAGLPLPGIYGPNEYYLKDRASFVYQAYHQLDAPLPPAADWVYVKDVVEVAYFLVHHRHRSGMYPVGTGRQYGAEELQQLVKDIAEGLDTTTAQAPLIPDELQAIGYDQPMHSLASGISDYMHTYLKTNTHY